MEIREEEYFSFPVNGGEDEGKESVRSLPLEGKVCNYCEEMFRDRDLNVKLCKQCLSEEKYFSFPVNGAGAAQAAQVKGLNSGTPLAVLMNNICNYFANNYSK